MTLQAPGTQSGPLAARFRARLARLGFDPQRDVLGLAVSGGGDSMAMLHLAHACGLRAQVATVDHGLRPDAAREAHFVAQVASDMGYAHDILPWQGWDGRGNVQDQARRARRRLLALWAQQRGLAAVALAHSQDDVAETFVMRLARGAGVDGLAAMRARFTAEGALFLRPLLDIARGEMRAFLAQIGATWVEDPSNDAPRFDRVRIRKAGPALDNLGLTAPVLASAAMHLRAASTALDWACDTHARAVLTENTGIVTLSPDWTNAPAAVQRRLLQRVIMWIAPAEYAPRGAALTRALARTAQGQPAQLAGCHLLPQAGNLWIFREYRSAAPPICPGASGPWDGVWHITGQASLHARAEMRALGPAGLAQWAGWRACGVPRAALLSQPSLWQDDRLIATPLRPDIAPLGAFFRRPGADMLYSSRLSD